MKAPAKADKLSLSAFEVRQVQADGDTIALKLMSERRGELVRSRTQAVNRLHQLLMELIPAGVSKDLTVGRAEAMLATVQPRDIAGRTRRKSPPTSSTTSQCWTAKSKTSASG